MKKKASINYFFPTLLFIIFIFAGLTSFLQLFGFCAAHFDVLADSLALAIVFCLVYMFACVELAKAADIHSIIIGGELRTNIYSCVGYLAEQVLGNLFLDKGCSAQGWRRRDCFCRTSARCQSCCSFSPGSL